MTKLGDGAVMEAPLMAMPCRPSPLLGCGTGPIPEIGMIFDLPKSSLVEQLLLGVMVRPGHEFNGSLAVAIDHIAATAVGRLSGHCTDLRESFLHSVAIATEWPGLEQVVTEQNRSIDLLGIASRDPDPPIRHAIR